MWVLFSSVEPAASGTAVDDCVENEYGGCRRLTTVRVGRCRVHRGRSLIVAKRLKDEKELVGLLVANELLPQK